MIKFNNYYYYSSNIRIINNETHTQKKKKSDTRVRTYRNAQAIVEQIAGDPTSDFP